MPFTDRAWVSILVGTSILTACNMPLQGEPPDRAVDVAVDAGSGEIAEGEVSELTSSPICGTPELSDADKRAVEEATPTIPLVAETGGSTHSVDGARTDVQDHPEAVASVSREPSGSDRRALTPTIDVHFHVISAGTTISEGNVPNAQIRAQVGILNAAFAPYFQFRLVSIDRTVNAEWAAMTNGSHAEAQAKEMLHRGGMEDLNIYAAAPSDYLTGWAAYPWYRHPRRDGIVIHYHTMPGGQMALFNEGDSAVHEAGHWLGLYHTFEGGCLGVSGLGDMVRDTPLEASAASGCPIGRDSCPASGVDPIHNYMDYSSDACSTEFTAEQGERMRRMWRFHRQRRVRGARPHRSTGLPSN